MMWIGGGCFGCGRHVGGIAVLRIGAATMRKHDVRCCSVAGEGRLGRGRIYCQEQCVERNNDECWGWFTRIRIANTGE